MQQLAERMVAAERTLEMLRDEVRGKTTELRDSVRALQDELSRLGQRVAAIEQRCAALEKHSDRSWQVWLALLAAGVSLLVSVLKK